MSGSIHERLGVLRVSGMGADLREVTYSSDRGYLVPHVPSDSDQPEFPGTPIGEQIRG